MKKIKLFVENMLVYGLGGVISKIVPLIMVPVITRIIPDSQYYGLSDLSSTLVSLFSAIAIMGMYDAMYRMFFDKSELLFKKKVCSTALAFTLGSSLFICMMIVLMKDVLSQLFFGSREYGYLIYISALTVLVGATNSIIAAPTRMQNKRKIFLVTNTISPILGYLVAVPLLMKGHYVIALPISSLVSAAVLEIAFLCMNYKWFAFRKIDFNLLKQLLVIAVPTMPVFLIYWVFNSSDRLMITNILGPSAEGIYAVGSKLGLASQLIYTAFAGGWQYFSFSTMHEADQVKNNSLIFEYLAVISFAAAAFICAISHPFYALLFEDEYISGYIVAPYLFLAPLLQMLFQVISNQFIIIKKTWPIAIILSGGAMANVFLNLILIPLLGIEGAAIATLIGYLLSDIIAVIVLSKMKLLVFSVRMLFAVLVIVGYFIAWRIFFSSHVWKGIMFSLEIVVVYIILWRKDIFTLLSMVRNALRK